MFSSFFVLVFEVGELSDEEDARIREVINYHSHTFIDLVMPNRLLQCGFDPNLGNS